MGIEPALFGPHLWATMHYIALGAPDVLNDSQRTFYKNFYNHLPFIIPCSSCGEHLTENLAKLPIDDALGGSAALFKWTVDLHNIVNKSLGKPEMTVEQAKAFWMSASASAFQLKTNNKKKVVLTLVVLLVLMGGAIYFSKDMLRKQSRMR